MEPPFSLRDTGPQEGRLPEGVCQEGACFALFPCLLSDVGRVVKFKWHAGGHGHCPCSPEGITITIPGKIHTAIKIPQKEKAAWCVATPFPSLASPQSWIKFALYIGADVAQAVW